MLASGMVAATLIVATIVSVAFAISKEAQRKLAEQRADETRKVAEFQAEILSQIDVAAMGRGLVKHLREQVKAGLEREYVGDAPNRRHRTPEEVEVELAIFDTSSSPGNPVDVARRVMDEWS
jgi:hypothetical protein